VRCSSDEKSPVVGIDFDARIMNPTALNLPTCQDLRHCLQASPVLLRVLQIQSRFRISRQSTIGIEVTPRIVETLSGPDQWGGFIRFREEARRGLKDPEVSRSPLLVDPAP